MKMNTLWYQCLFVLGSLQIATHAAELRREKDPWLVASPVDTSVFVTTKGNNHDSLFVESELEYPYHLIISHTPQYIISGDRSFLDQRGLGVGVRSV